MTLWREVPSHTDVFAEDYVVIFTETYLDNPQVITNYLDNNQYYCIVSLYLGLIIAS